MKNSPHPFDAGEPWFVMEKPELHRSGIALQGARGICPVLEDGHPLFCPLTQQKQAVHLQVQTAIFGV
jgi:hypothetical protein